MTVGVPRILIVDDEPPIRKFLKISLSAQSFEIIEAAKASEALEQIASNPPDLIVLDLGLPDADGKDLIHAIRAMVDVPIIVLSIRTAEKEKISALDFGASDYVTKPFAIGELTARIRALLRDNDAGAATTERVLEVGRIRIDFSRHRVMLDDAEIRLTPKEYDLLTVLMTNAGRIVTHRQLLREVWGPKHEDDTQYLRVYVGQLRDKLGDNPADPHFIINEPGIGYRFASP